jgi:hypothetical protein
VLNQAIPLGRQGAAISYNKYKRRKGRGMRMKNFAALCAAGVLALTLVACGSGDSPSAAPLPDPEPPPSVTNTPPPVDGSPTPTPPAVTPGPTAPPSSGTPRPTAPPPQPTDTPSGTPTPAQPTPTSTPTATPTPVVKSLGPTASLPRDLKFGECPKPVSFPQTGWNGASGTGCAYTSHGYSSCFSIQCGGGSCSGKWAPEASWPKSAGGVRFCFAVGGAANPCNNSGGGNGNGVDTFTPVQQGSTVLVVTTCP